MASPINFQGISTGLNTSSLIDAIMQQEGQPLQRMQVKQALNTKRSTLLSSLSVSLLSLSTSMNTLNTSAFQTQLVTSSDANNTYATASATGATPGSYAIQVGQIATKASQTFGFGSLTSAVGTGQYAIKDVDGTTKTFTIGSTNNTLGGLRDAINASGAGVNATIVDTGKTNDPNRYQLVLNAKNTGLGTGDRDVFTIAQIGGSNQLGIATDGVLTDGVLTSGGTDAATKAKNAIFWVNGIELNRASNTVSDAVEGMTFTLKSGGQTALSTPTTLTVATDKEGITKAFQDVVSKFNAFLKVYKDNSQYSASASGSTSTSKDTLPESGPLANQPSLRGMISQVRSAIMSVPTSLAAGNYYHSAAEVGLKTNQDGTLSLDATALKAALDKNPTAVAEVFDKVNSTLQNTVSTITSPGSGSLAKIRQNIDSQNSFLNLRIDSMQSHLDRRKAALQAQYANLEKTIGLLQSAGQSLGAITSG